jgi:replicative DNA helicase
MSGIDRINGTVARLAERDYPQMVYDTVASLREAAGADYFSGVQAYLRDFDDHTLGLQPTDLTILRGAPRYGQDRLCHTSCQASG